MKPLQGIRILEFDGLGPITLAGMMLADMGAEVLRLTRKSAAGDPFADVGGAVLHRARPVVAIDLKDADDVAKVVTLAGSADAVIEAYRPGVMERLGLGPDQLQRANPALTYVRLTGWGQTGPLAQTVGHDINYLAQSGLLHALGEPDRPARAPLNLLADYAGGSLPAVIGLLAGVLSARSTGQGRVVDVAMLDSLAGLSSLFQALMAKGLWQEKRGHNLLDGAAPFYRCYACADGREVAVGALEPRFYAALLEGLGIQPEAAPQMDLSRWSEMSQTFADRFASQPRSYWTEVFAGTEACVSPVLAWSEVMSDPHGAAHGLFTGERPRQPAPFPRFDGTPAHPDLSGSNNLSLDEALAHWINSAGDRPSH